LLVSQNLKFPSFEMMGVSMEDKVFRLFVISTSLFFRDFDLKLLTFRIFVLQIPHQARRRRSKQVSHEFFRSYVSIAYLKQESKYG
jgi:hypothetical protein